MTITSEDRLAMEQIEEEEEHHLLLQNNYYLYCFLEFIDNKKIE
jgi:hypothetical protein